jgi:CHAT domain-containing protein/Tfp pilus assembly protein PilF
MTQRNKRRQSLKLQRRQYAYRALASLSTLLLFFSPMSAVFSRQVFAGSLSLLQQSVQQSRETGSGDIDERDVRELESDKPVRSELAAGSQHDYRIRLNAYQFLKVIVEQQGIDLVVRVAGPDGKRVVEFDTESRLQGREDVTVVAEEAGNFLFTVRSRSKGASAGSYEIRIEELRVATDTDLALHIARQQFNEAIKLEAAGEYKEALGLYELALETRERLLGAEHSDVASSIDGVAGCYTSRAQYVKAEPLNLRALAIRKKVFGEDHPLTAQSITNLATLYYYQGKYKEAEPLFKRALDINERALGKDHPYTAISFHNLASLYDAQGKYDEAEPLYKRDLEFNEKTLGDDHQETATSVHSLATLYYNKGEYKEAERLYERALGIYERALGKDHPYTGGGASSLALVYVMLGKYDEAELLYKRALAIREKTLGKDHPSTAVSLGNLAELYSKQGKYEEAESLHKRALDIREKALGKDHPDTANGLHNLAALYRKQGKYSEAEPLYRRALAIREKALSKDHPLTANSLSNLADLYTSQGKYLEAEPLHKRALAIREKALGKDHPLTANSFHNLGLLYRGQGKYLEAEPLFKRALDIFEKSLGKDHPDTGASLNNLAMLYIAKGDLAQAVKFQSRANAASERNLAHNLITGSERDKLAYLATVLDQTDRTISLHIRSAPNDPEARKLAATMILQRKGRALDATSQNFNALRSRFNPEDQELLDRLKETHSQIARMVLSGPQRMSSERHQARIKELEDQAEKDAANISRRSDEFRALFAPVTLEAVRAAIPLDSALIEFASYRPFNAKAVMNDETYGQARYVAYILRRGGEIECRDLGEAKSIDSAIEAFRKALRDPRRVDVKRLARVVDAKIFQPIRPLLGSKSRLLISPDGSLNLIPFAALVDERGRFEVERYSISYLTSGRDLLRLKAPREAKGGPLVVAAPDFGGKGLLEIAGLEKRENGASPDEGKAESARSAVRDLYFPPLPDAAQEGEALQALFPGATLLTKGQATTAALRQVHSPEILHIATHGFFLEDRQLTSAGERSVQPLSNDSERALRQLEQRGIPVESPLLRSGLALAGANEHKEDDNGILTALEVTGLNLWGTKLVTLSACDTGVGEVKNGDGVHGLRRALVLAGSETQLMSLWAVSDRATRELMVSYYSRLKHGEGRGESLRRVQLNMLNKMKWRHPYFWASFIQSGAWTNLEGN